MSESTLLERNNGVKVLKTGNNAKGEWKLYGLLDEYGEVFGSWFNDASLKREIDDSGGGALEVEWEHNDRGGKTIKSVGAPVDKPADSLDAVISGGGFSNAQAAWISAALMAKADLGYDAAKHLADRIFADLKLKSGEPDEFPF